MEKIDVLMWAIGGGFVITLGCFKIIWNEIKDMNKTLNTKFDARFDKVDIKIDKLDAKLDSKFESMNRDLKEICTIMYRLEGAIINKDCCMLKGEKKKKKAE